MLYIPGDEIKEKIKMHPTATRLENGKIYANVIGMVSDNVFKPFELAYVANVGDLIVGVVYEKKPNVIFVDTSTSYTGLVMAKAIRIEIKQGDIISGKVSKIEESDIILSDISLLSSRNEIGTLISIPPSKVARIIGKDATMISLIKEKTSCKIVVGMNGYIWIQGKNAEKAVKAILFIIKRAHLQGLTSKVEQILA